jgi:hypothetical protein
MDARQLSSSASTFSVGMMKLTLGESLELDGTPHSVANNGAEFKFALFG